MMSKRKEEAIIEEEGCGMLLSRAYKRRSLQRRKDTEAHTRASKHQQKKHQPAASSCEELPA
jgi:hypothetical protein